MSVGNDKLRLLRQIPTIKFEEEMRGYSKAQVDRVLDILAPLADEIEALQVQVAEATTRADEASHRANAIASAAPQDLAPAPVASPDGDFDETLRNTLLLAQRTADQTIRDAEANAEEARRVSTAKADSVMAGARAEAKELKGEAHAQREQMLADAESERAELLADALEHAETRKSAIEEELLSEQGIRRNELLAEISQLERSRDDLNADVVRFEQFLEGRRTSVANSLEELKAILDDPELLAEAETPEPAEIGLLDPEELTPLHVESHSIGALSHEVEAAQQQAADFAFTEVEDDEPVYAEEIVADPVGETLGLDETATFEPAPVEHTLVDPGFEAIAPEAVTDEDPVSEASPAAAPFETAAEAEIVPPAPVGFDEVPTPAAEFAAAIDGDASFPPGEGAQDEWQPFAGEAGTEAVTTPVVETPAFEAPTFDEPYEAPVFESAPAPQYEAPAPQPFSAQAFESESMETQPFLPEAPAADPFAAGGYIDEPGADLGGIAASVTPDSVFSSVPETADPAAYSDLPAPVDQGMADPAGLGIDVESPFSEEVAEEEGQAGLGGLAEQARNRLASRVSRLRDTAVPEAADVAEAPYAAPFDAGDAMPADAMPFDAMPAEATAFDAPVPPAPEFGEQAVSAGFPPPPETAFATDSSPAFPSDSVGGAEWSAPDPNRPMHPDAHLEDLPAADPFLDELRQRTEGDLPEGDDETLNRFLSEDGEKEGGGGWFGRRNK